MDNSTKLKVIAVKSPPPNPLLIAMLRQLLADARAGRLLSVAAVWDHIDPGTGRETSYMSRGKCGWALIGGLEVLKAELVRRMLKEPVADDGES